jgi:ABC-type methionine transport system permease subunit
LEEILIVATKHGGIAKAAISTVLKKIDSMVKCIPFLIVELAPKGEIVKESDILITIS